MQKVFHINLFVQLTLIQFLQVTCGSKKIQNFLTAPKYIYDIKQNAIASKEKTLDMKFNKDYNLKIDSSNVDLNYAALCVITKNDYIYDIKEFLEYHFKIGIGRIYLFDTGTNNSQQLKVFEFFSNFLKDGRLYYSYWNYGAAKLGFNMQIDIYNKCAQSFAENHVWLGFIDTDEFIILRNPDNSQDGNNKNNEKEHQNYFQYKKLNNQNSKIIQDKMEGVKNIQDFLKQYEQYGALTMNWVLFGSGGYETHQKSTLNTYTQCLLHDHVKTIINVRFWNKRIGNVHFINPKNFLQNRFAVDENFKMNGGPINKQFPAKKIAVFHYVIKSAVDYAVKMKRGDASGHQVRQMVFYDFVNNNANFTCTDGRQLYKQLFAHKIQNL